MFCQEPRCWYVRIECVRRGYGHIHFFTNAGPDTVTYTHRVYVQHFVCLAENSVHPRIAVFYKIGGKVVNFHILLSLDLFSLHNHLQQRPWAQIRSLLYQK